MDRTIEKVSLEACLEHRTTDLNVSEARRTFFPWRNACCCRKFEGSSRIGNCETSFGRHVNILARTLKSTNHYETFQISNFEGNQPLRNVPNSNFGINQPCKNVLNFELWNQPTLQKRSEFRTLESIDLAETTFRELINHNRVFKIKCCSNCC